MGFLKILKKFTSRKFLISLASLATGIGMIFFENDSGYSTIASVLLVGIPSIVYCIVEGNLDVQNLRSIVDSIEKTEKQISDGMADEDACHIEEKE